MSIQSMSWAIEQQEIKDPIARLVLICMANYADKNGQGIFPSVETLKADTGLSERAIRYKIGVMVDSGVLVAGNPKVVAAYIDRKDKRPMCYDIVMNRGAPHAPGEAAGCTTCQNGVHVVPERGAPHAPNPSLNLQLTEEHVAAVEKGIPFGRILELYHGILPQFPRVRSLTPDRKKAISGRWNDSADCQSIDYWEGFFQRVERSDFLSGRLPRNGGHETWRCDFDWLVNPNNHAKIMEGKYDNLKASTSASAAPVQAMLDLYHKHCPLMERALLTEPLIAAMTERWREEPDLGLWEFYFKECGERFGAEGMVKWITGEKRPYLALLMTKELFGKLSA